MNNASDEGQSQFGRFLQGVQHIGITVQDMAKSLAFYTEILGGRIVVAGDSLASEPLYHTLFQREEMDAREQGIDPRTLGVANIRDNKHQVLDVRFISFGNTVVELLHFRDATADRQSPNYFPNVPACVGFGNVFHLAFQVREDVDLNQFAKRLEDGCRMRGIDLTCNRIIHVRSEQERRMVDMRYTANKFWDDSAYHIDGYSDTDFGEFTGWALFYAKGPNGEQLEFNQATRKIKEHFIRAQREYNRDTGTDFQWPSTSCGRKT